MALQVTSENNCNLSGNNPRQTNGVYFIDPWKGTLPLQVPYFQIKENSNAGRSDYYFFPKGQIRKSL